MKTDDILSSELVLKWDEELKSLLVVNPKLNDSRRQLIGIRGKTLLEMNFEQAIAFNRAPLNLSVRFYYEYAQ